MRLWLSWLSDQGKPFDATVQALMESTYYQQRVDIVSGSSMPDLLASWPYLFVDRGLLGHSKMLLGVDPVANIIDFVAKKGDTLKRYLKVSSKRKTSLIFDNESSAPQQSDINSGHRKTAALILAVLAEFVEKSDQLFVEAKDTSSASEVEQLPTSPETPGLVLCGESLLTVRRMMLVMDKLVVASHIEDMVVGIGMMFVAYFVFNIKFPLGAASTLEFNQRCLVHINPETGSKVQRDKRKKSTTMSSKVLGLINGLAQYEWTEQ